MILHRNQTYRIKNVFISKHSVDLFVYKMIRVDSGPWRELKVLQLNLDVSAEECQPFTKWVLVAGQEWKKFDFFFHSCEIIFFSIILLICFFSSSLNQLIWPACVMYHRIENKVGSYAKPAIQMVHMYAQCGA